MSIFSTKTEDGTLNVLIFGKVTRDPERKETQRGSKWRWSVNYAKSKYMDCEAWSDSPAGEIAGMLEHGDLVSVAGTHRSHEYNGKTYQNIEVDFVGVSIGMAQALNTALGTGGENAAPAGDAPKLAVKMEEITEDDGQLPF